MKMRESERESNDGRKKAGEMKSGRGREKENAIKKKMIATNNKNETSDNGRDWKYTSQYSRRQQSKE